ncbi:porin [Tundrisphaera lichenicola]|uniref:OprO/OprP family phosphate-selective porin n=1 Tax=Tundrisphaera lichenicola TaxID=2029860 RepID=UPI003EBFAE0F
MGVALWPRGIQAQDPPPTPSPSPPQAQPDPAQLAEQVRQLAEMNQRLAEQLGDLSRKYDDLSRQVGGSIAAPPGSTTTSGGVPPSPGGAGGPSGIGDGSPNSSSSSTPDAGESGGGIVDVQDAQADGNRRRGKIKLGTTYDYDKDGFLFSSDDSEFQLKVRALAQIDAHIYQQSNQDPVKNGFYIPRARLYFSGRVTKPIEYMISFQRGYDNFDLLNGFINFNYDERAVLRVGRFKTPYTYEFYKIEAQDLLAPERSLFNINFQGNRQIGAMFYGQLFKKRMEYAVGTFDGARNSYRPFSDNQDVMAFFNFRPFLETESALKHLNVGGSLDYGSQDNPTVPMVFRTSSQVSSSTLNGNTVNATANVPFFAFNGNVRERGLREQWELHTAYFYKGLSLIGAWDSGKNTYGFDGSTASPVSVPIGGYSIQGAYILTGETRNDNGLIDPIHPFDLRPGKFGLGAIEPTARYSSIFLNRRVFDAGFSDPKLWTNAAYMTDIGFNWYLNKFTKIYFDWQHAVFGEPVYYRPGAKQLTSDLFWLRFQVYF